MRFLYRAVLVAAAGIVLAPAPSALAADTSNSEFVIIREDDVFPEDLYAGAISVIVDGTLDGDLIAFAADEIVINGTVTGSVIAISPRVEINGEVGDSLRVAGNRLEIAGRVDGDVVAAVYTADLAGSSEVTGDLLVWSWWASAIGTVGGDLTGSQRTLELAGSVGGDVDTSTSRLTIVDDLSVTGDLGYRSSREVQGLDLATVGGAVVGKAPLPPNLRVRALALLGRFLVILFLSVAALSVAYGWPDRTSRAVAEAGRRPIRRWLLGASILFSPLLAVAVTGLILGIAPAAAAFPLLAVLVPVVLALVGIVFALTLVAGAPAVGWLGGVVFRRLDLYGSILVGSILVGVAWYLPVVGWVVPLVVLPWGIGGWWAAWRAQSSEDENLAAATA